jgi:phosphinothricin acetyltransferase
VAGTDSLDLRPGGTVDLPAIVGIYNHYVLHSNATFDEAAVTVESRQPWIAAFRPSGPHRWL